MLLAEKIGNAIPECINEGKDTYKRTLAECFVNDESLSKFLVRSGYAFAYRKYSKKFIEDEEYAKTNKLGMWAMTFQYPWDFRKASWKVYQVVKLEEVILNIEEKTKRKIKKKYVKFPKRLNEQRKTVSEQSQDELEPIISTPINSPMSDE